MDEDDDIARRVGPLLDRFVLGTLSVEAFAQQVLQGSRAPGDLPPPANAPANALANAPAVHPEAHLRAVLRHAAEARGIGPALTDILIRAVLAAPAAEATEATPAKLANEALLSAFVDRFKSVRHPAAERRDAPDPFGTSLTTYEGLRQRRRARETVRGHILAPLQACPAAEVQVGTTLRERFVLDTELGRGGMGVVFRAVDRRRLDAGASQPYVAIKVLNLSFATHPDALRALETEARRTQDLTDPRIVTVYDFDRDGDVAFIVMELLTGLPLDRVLREEPRFCGSALARRLMQDLFETLAFAHAQGAVHADLKPANLYLCKDGRLKLLDFGVSVALGAADERTLALSAMTPAYASPERGRGGAPTPSDDVYALGCIIHLLLTGEHPFHRRSGIEAEAEMLVPPELPMLPAPARRAVRSALAFDARERPEDAGAFVRATRGGAPDLPLAPPPRGTANAP